MNEEIVVPIFLFGGTAVVLWKFFETRHQERMSIIEKGLVKEELKYLYSSNISWKINPLTALKYGILAAFIGLGLWVNAVFSSYFWGDQDQFTIGTIFLFGGIGLVLFYAIVVKKEKQEKS
jgi:hypothetical protein